MSTQLSMLTYFALGRTHSPAAATFSRKMQMDRRTLANSFILRDMMWNMF